MIKTGADVGGMHKANAGIDSKRLLHQMSLCSKQRVRAEKGNGLGVPWGIETANRQYVVWLRQMSPCSVGQYGGIETIN